MDKLHSYRNKGFTLIEVLIALAVLAIALIAVLRALHVSIKSAQHLQEKVYAHWVAENMMANAMLGVVPVPNVGGNASGQQVVMNQTFLWTLSTTMEQAVPALLLTVRITDAQQINLDEISIYLPLPSTNVGLIPSLDFGGS